MKLIFLSFILAFSMSGFAQTEVYVYGSKTKYQLVDASFSIVGDVTELRLNLHPTLTVIGHIPGGYLDAKELVQDLNSPNSELSVLYFRGSRKFIIDTIRRTEK